MNRLFVRIFLWFWLATTCLVLVVIAGLLLAQPDAMAAWRLVGQTSIRYFGFQVANVFEKDGPANAESLLAEVSRDGRLRVWLYAAEGQPVGKPLDGAQDLVRRAFAGEDAESVTGGRFLLARRIASSSGKPYVIVWQASFGLRVPLPVSPARLGVQLTGLILTGAIVCWWLTWQITMPVRVLRSAARQVAQGDLSLRVSGRKELNTRDELADLGRDFDHMAGRIEDLVKSQQQLLADISHELRSPLARLSLALDLARRRLGDGVPEHQRIEREVQRLNDLIEQLLTMTRLHGHPDQFAAEALDLRGIVHEVAEDARFEAEAGGRWVVVAGDCDTRTRGNRALLRSALENVVRNAIRHAPPNTEVTIQMERLSGSGRLLITVRDRGPGVPALALGRLFDPFFRVDAGRDRNSGGVGLGLAIVRQAMLAHGGNASAQNHPGGGLVVELELPADGKASS